MTRITKRLLIVCILLFSQPQIFQIVSASPQPGYSQVPTQRQIFFSGFFWEVRSGFGAPGHNHWSNSTDNVWVDGSGQLHLRLTYRNGVWYASEVIGPRLGLGEYIFYTSSRVDSFDRNIVAGLFVYENDTREIDVEFSQWGGFANNSQYVVQPAHAFTFYTSLNGNYSTHQFIWTNESVGFRSIHGHYSEPPNSHYVIAQWLYANSHLSQSETRRVHLNLWLYQNSPPFDGNEAELIIQRFEFVPESGA